MVGGGGGEEGWLTTHGLHFPTTPVSVQRRTEDMHPPAHETDLIVVYLNIFTRFRCLSSLCLAPPALAQEVGRTGRSKLLLERGLSGLVTPVKRDTVAHLR